MRAAFVEVSGQYQEWTLPFCADAPGDGEIRLLYARLREWRNGRFAATASRGRCRRPKIGRSTHLSFPKKQLRDRENRQLLGPDSGG
jgi:hypothetical protein